MTNVGIWLAKSRRTRLAVAALSLFALSFSDRAEAAGYIEPHQCGGNEQPACYISAAKFEKKINPGDGAFRDPRKGGEWWNCHGWKRSWDAVDSGTACVEGGWFSKTKRASFIYSEKAMVDSGAFPDPREGGEWWRCPSGFTRNANPVDKGEACSATIGKACDSGLVDIRDPSQKGGGGFTCYKKGECGAEGQRVCTIVADGSLRTPCNKGLEEDILTVRCRIGAFGDVGDLDKDFDKFYQSNWEGRAIIDQVELSLDVPLAKATMIGSHNSYNSKSYNYLDPNQYLTLLDQLKGGAHFIELDLHDFAMDQNNQDNKDVILCHTKQEKKEGFAKLTAGGCSSNDKKIADGLDEVKTFLEDAKYKNRIVIIYFENFSKETDKIYNAVQQKIGQYVYNSNGCKAIPADTLTAGQILGAGKRVLIWNGTEVEKACSDNQNFKNMVFTGLGSIGRTWEDEPSLSAASGGGSKWKPADVVKEIEAGKNLANHDFLYINDEYKAMAWSWNVNEPNDVGGEDCAAQTAITRLGQGHVWNDISCSTGGLAYACENSSGNWKVTTAASVGQWSQGDAMCKKDHGAGYFFSVPATAEENKKLAKIKPAGWSVWLNYTDQAQEGKWVAKHRWNSLSVQPVAHWEFNDNLGKASNLLGVADDTGSGNLGATVATGATINAAGFLQLPNSTDGYASIPDNNSIDFGANQDFTVSAWIYPDATQRSQNGDSDVIEKWSGAGGYPYVIRYINRGADHGKVVVARYDGANNPAISSTKTINDGRAHHVAFVKSGGTLLLYIDGQADGTTPDTSTGNTINTSPLYLGNRGNHSNYFNGHIDDLRIYNVGLSATQVASLAGTQKQP